MKFIFTPVLSTGTRCLVKPPTFSIYIRRGENRNIINQNKINEGYSWGEKCRLLNVSFLSLRVCVNFLLFAVKSTDTLWINEAVKILLDKSLGSVERALLLQSVEQKITVCRMACMSKLAPVGFILWESYSKVLKADFPLYETLKAAYAPDRAVLLSTNFTRVGLKHDSCSCWSLGH